MLKASLSIYKNSVLSFEEQIKISNFLDAELSIKEISKRTGKSLATIYKYRKLREEKLPQYSVIGDQIPRKIFAFKEIIDSYLKDNGGSLKNVSKFFRELKGRGYKGSYSLLHLYLRAQIDDEVKSKYKRSRHIETGPGEQAQVDWGSFGEIKIGDRFERLYAFVYVLSYSRAMYAEFVTRQNQQTFQNCHIHAFEHLGIPQTIRYDNVKTVVLGREKLGDGTKKIHFNPAFVDFAAYYGFEPELCPPYWPRAKGKVEAGVKYLRNNFMQGEIWGVTFKSLDELNRKLDFWLNFIAQQREHGTTKERPVDRWMKEKDFLHFSGNLAPYATAASFQRMSTKDGLVHYKSNLYSVPTKFSRKKLFVRELSKQGQPILEIYYQGRLIATHQISVERGQWIVNDDHILDTETKLNIRKVSDQEIVEGSIDNYDIAVATRDLSYYNMLIPKD